MFFLTSKLFWLVAKPAVLCMIAIAVGLFSPPAYAVAARRVAIAGFGILALLALTSLSSLIIHPLEQRFPEITVLPPGSAIAGIILLGGFEQGSLSQQHHTLMVNDSAGRLLAGLRLARQYPAAKIIFAGGAFDATDQGGAEAVSKYLQDSGIAPSRIVLETQSRTTYENGLYLRPILNPKRGDRYVLVTSAFHMPRAVGVFRVFDIDIIPYPVDYRTGTDDDELAVSVDPADNLRLADLAIKEWIGLLAYRLAGRTSALWPGPEAEKS